MHNRSHLAVTPCVYVVKLLNYKEMVVGRRKTSNRLIELIQSVNNLGKLLNAPPLLNSKTFEWSPLLKAA